MIGIRAVTNPTYDGASPIQGHPADERVEFGLCYRIEAIAMNFAELRRWQVRTGSITRLWQGRCVQSRAAACLRAMTCLREKELFVLRTAYALI